LAAGRPLKEGPVAEHEKRVVKYGELLPPAHRDVAVRPGSKVGLPALPRNAAAAYAQNHYLQAHLHAVSLIDRYHAWREEEVAELNHQRELAKLRREREQHEAEHQALEARRKTLQSAHGLEADELFKEHKFKLGRVRAAARRKDAEVEKSTAEAAIRKLGGQLQKQSKGNGSFNGALDALISALEQEARQGDADGADTADLHAELRALQRLKARL
jgi:hypothetical protein